ncbi:hypothetical protein CLOBY_40370 [Clostridium saccharobutylicum]|nr:hypothetical protein CLOSC_41020 [Clostridium saccharobutylicum]AQS02275.1 hypothetical protein CSACC_41080 [Clostridium saccharobutylicum]AQS11879.1 hypothetical protein CLOBY_40370 [Clostridium saccharobutylicum]AQS16258.1 hypothetical protein CLOSACC_41080 [Clostridium saccharobutylicum]MBA2904933.1 hypothetical protein [Clostridium saccharobutylicum]
MIKKQPHLWNLKNVCFKNLERILLSIIILYFHVPKCEILLKKHG